MRWLFGLALFVGVLSGCGGGGEAAAVAPELETVSGPMRLQGQVGSPVIATNSSGLSIFGFAGTISKAYWTDTDPTTAETEIVFGMSTLRDGIQIVVCEPDGSNLRPLAKLSAEPSEIRLSPDGVWCYYAENNVLKRVSMSGGAVTNLMSDVSSFALTPSGTRILAYRPGADDVVAAGIDGTGVTVLMASADTDLPQIVGCVNEEFGFIIQAPATTSPYFVRLALSGTGPNANVFGLTPAALHGVTLSAARDRIVVRQQYLSDNKVYLYDLTLPDSGIGYVVLRDDLAGTDEVRQMKPSPSGDRFVAIQQNTATNESCIITLDRDHNVLNTVFRGRLGLTAPAWAPSPTFRTFVGAGNYAAGAAALLFSDLNSRTPSVVLADANPRSSMNLTRVSGDNDGTIIYEMTCDALTKLHYTKSNSFAQIGVIGSLTGLKGAIVAFNSTTGRVSNVITFTKKPSVSKPGDRWVVEGDGLVEHYKGDGERRAASNRVVIE